MIILYDVCLLSVVFLPSSSYSGCFNALVWLFSMITLPHLVQSFQSNELFYCFIGKIVALQSTWIKSKWLIFEYLFVSAINFHTFAECTEFYLIENHVNSNILSHSLLCCTFFVYDCSLFSIRTVDFVQLFCVAINFNVSSRYFNKKKLHQFSFIVESG